MEWKKASDLPVDDENYLVSWQDVDGTYSLPHKSYYLNGRFFSLENNNSHPLHVDIYCEMPKVPK